MKATSSPRKAQISERAMLARLRRSLEKDGEILRRNRSSRDTSLGDWYVVDGAMNAVIHHDVDPEQMARELGLLKPYEEVASD